MKKSLSLLLASLSILIFTTLSQAEDLTAQTKEWTILVFLNGHNNLDQFGEMNIKQMAQIGSSSEVNMVVQWASLKNKDTKRLFVEKNNIKVVETMKPVDMGDYKELVEFVEWAHKKYPAKKYMIDVWNHGNGWHRIQSGEFKPQDISYDDITGNKITTEQLGIAMEQVAKITGSKVELYASDACLMSMIEVATQMKDSVKYFAGSQDLEPGEGWAYHTFLGPLVKNPKMNGGELGKILSKEYLAAYSGGIYGTQDVTFSVLDLAKLPQYLSSMKSLTQEMMGWDSSGIKAAKEAMGNTQYFAFDDYKDATDYLLLVGKARNLKSLSKYHKARNDLVIANDVSKAFSRAKGVSIWIPMKYDWDTYGDRYLDLEFHKETGWGNFLKLIAH